MSSITCALANLTSVCSPTDVCWESPLVFSRSPRALGYWRRRQGASCSKDTAYDWLAADLRLMAEYPKVPQYDAVYKVTVIGDSQVGKTTIIRKFVDHGAPDHYPPTIGVDFGLKDIVVDSERCRVQIWDTAGQERFRAVTSCYFRGAHGVVLVYDVTQAKTFDNLQFHLAQAQQFTADDQPMIMVDNKCDLTEQRAVPYALAASYAEDLGMPLVETSAKTLANVEQVFLQLIDEIRKRNKQGKRGEVRERRPSIFTRSRDRRGGCCSP